MAEHYGYEEPSTSRTLNRTSSLPSSKSRMKRAIKERIRILVAGYISLATFVDDDSVDFLEFSTGSDDKEIIKKKSMIYKEVIKSMDRLEKEMRDFDPFELPTAGR